MRDTCVCVCYNASMCSHYIIHDDVMQVSRMMCLDVHTSRHLVHNVTYMMTYNDDSSRRDLNLVENLVETVT